MEKINVCADKIQMVRVGGERRDRITIAQHKYSTDTNSNTAQIQIQIQIQRIVH